MRDMTLMPRVGSALSKYQGYTTKHLYPSQHFQNHSQENVLIQSSEGPICL
jgi:hypothetical protein